MRLCAEFFLNWPPISLRSISHCKDLWSRMDSQITHVKNLSGGVFEVQVATWPHQRAETLLASKRLLLDELDYVQKT